MSGQFSKNILYHKGYCIIIVKLLFQIFRYPSSTLCLIMFSSEVKFNMIIFIYIVIISIFKKIKFS